MLNKWIGVGYIGSDLQLKANNANLSILNFNLGVQRQFKNAQDEYDTDWFKVVAFGRNAENTVQYCKKGSLVLVEAHLQTRSYEKDGQTHYVTEAYVDTIQFLDSKKEDDAEYFERKHNEAHKDDVKVKEEVSDDSLPF